MYSLFVDTDSDITPEIAKEYGAHLIIMPYTLLGKEVRPYEDFEVFNGEKIRHNPLTELLISLSFYR